MTHILPIRLTCGALIGVGRPCFLVAELGNNHQGDYQLARDMVHAAKESGADAVKFQKRDLHSLLTQAGVDAPYTGPNSFGPTYGEHRLALELALEHFFALKELTESLGMVFFATAWDALSLKQIADLDCELVKISSADLVNIPLLREAAHIGKPVVLSTGMSTLEEIDRAVSVLREINDRLILLHCNSSYPCPEEEIGLPVMDVLAKRYNALVGYSGHEKGMAPSVAAAALGAVLIERHFTLDKSLRGTDHQASLDPSLFGDMVRMIREVEKAMFVTEKRVFPREHDSAMKLRKSIVAAKNLKAGQRLDNGELTVKSPGAGLSPLLWDHVRGMTLACDVAKDEFLDWDMLANDRQT